ARGSPTRERHDASEELPAADVTFAVVLRPLVQDVPLQISHRSPLLGVTSREAAGTSRLARGGGPHHSSTAAPLRRPHRRGGEPSRLCAPSRDGDPSRLCGATFRGSAGMAMPPETRSFSPSWTLIRRGCTSRSGSMIRYPDMGFGVVGMKTLSTRSPALAASSSCSGPSITPVTNPIWYSPRRGYSTSTTCWKFTWRWRRLSLICFAIV